MAAERGSYTFDIMVDEFVTFVVAGMETTANSLALSMMELARRPDLVERFVLQTNDEKKTICPIHTNITFINRNTWPFYLRVVSFSYTCML